MLPVHGIGKKFQIIDAYPFVIAQFFFGKFGDGVPDLVEADRIEILLAVIASDMVPFGLPEEGLLQLGRIHAGNNILAGKGIYSCGNVGFPPFPQGSFPFGVCLGRVVAHVEFVVVALSQYVGLDGRRIRCDIGIA